MLSDFIVNDRIYQILTRDVGYIHPCFDVIVKQYVSPPGASRVKSIGHASGGKMVASDWMILNHVLLFIIGRTDRS